jgi:hypothetical protein
MMNTQKMRNSTRSSTSLKKTKKKPTTGVGAYFRTSSSADDDSDSSRSNNMTPIEDDDDDDVSIVSQGSVSSMRSSLGMAASSSVRLLKKTVTMPVALATKTTKTVARKGYQAGSAVVQGTSKVVVTTGTAVGNSGKALAHGTTAVVVGGSKAFVGGTTKVVKGSSKAFMNGTSAIVGGTTAVTKKTVRGLQHGASHIRPGRRAARRRSQKASQMNQWDADMETLEEILEPGSETFQALSQAQRKSLHRMKMMLLQQGPQLSGHQTAAHLPMDLIQLEKRQQKMLRRNSNASSNGNGSFLQETASVYSEASYILQEYGGVTNPTNLLLSNQSEELDDVDDLLDMTNTSDLSMSLSKDEGYLMAHLPNTSITEEGEDDATDIVQESKAGTVPADRASKASVAAEGNKTTSSPAEKPAQKADEKKKLKKKSRAPPPSVTLILQGAEIERQSAEHATYIPTEFYELGGRETQLAVYKLLRWESLASWDYDIFDLDRYTGGNALLFMGWAVLGAPYAQCAMAHACGVATLDDTFVGYPFMDKLKIPPQKLIQYLRVIQQDYHADNPYHNAIHAADVLQTLHSMIQMALRRGTNDRPEEEQSDDSDITRDGFFVRSCPNFLKLFSILLAAVVHDADHPGRNNAFHTRLKTELAVFYNDKSVLENWHIAHAFGRMLGLDLVNYRNFHNLDEIHSGRNYRDCDCNLLCNASADEFATIRNIMIEAILQTDMTKHFALVTDLKSMLLLLDEAEKTNGPINHDDDSTLSLLIFMLHQADISGQAKADPLFLNWSDRCQQEFFSQGDEEAALGMSPISPYCDRKTTNQAVAQTGFVEFVVQASYEVLGEYIPEIHDYVLPIIHENLDFWCEAAGKPRKVEVKDDDES